MPVSAEKIELEAIHLFNRRKYQAFFTTRQLAYFGDSVPGNGHFLFGASCHGEAAGVVWGGPDRNPAGIFIFHLYVAERFRRHGIGRILLTAVCDAARNSGFEEVYLRFRRRNSQDLALQHLLDTFPGACVRLETVFRLKMISGAEQELGKHFLPERWRMVPLENALADMKKEERTAMEERERRSREELDKLSLSEPASWRDLLHNGIFLSPFMEKKTDSE